MSNKDSLMSNMNSVLNYLANDRGDSSLEQIKSSLNIDADIIRRCLNQLIRDGYAEERTSTNVLGTAKIGTGRYYILFSGEILSMQGGYTHLLNEGERLRIIENRQDRVARRLLFANWMIAVSTSIAALYYLMEIFRIWFLPHLA